MTKNQFLLIGLSLLLVGVLTYLAKDAIFNATNNQGFLGELSGVVNNALDNNPGEKKLTGEARSVNRSNVAATAPTKTIIGKFSAQNSITTITNQTSASQIQSANTQVSLCSSNSPKTLTRSALINEIAWAGISSDKTSEEWIELKNNSGTNISLDGWQIQNQNQNIKIFFSAADSIPVNSFYLLERGSANFINSLKADKFFTNAIKNSDEAIRLFDKNCNVVDEVITDQGTVKNWPAGTASPDYRTAERSADLSWHTFNGNSSAGSPQVFGTPRAENSLPQLPPSSPSTNSGSPPVATTPTTYYTLQVFKSGNGAGSISSDPIGISCASACVEDSEDFVSGVSITLIATPTDGSEFTGWSGDCSGNSNCVIQMDGNKSVTAIFNQIISSPPPPPPASSAKIIINEILFNPAGSDTGKEFVELYNAGGLDSDSKDWSLRLMDDQSTSTTSFALIGSNTNDITSISTHKYFLIGLNNYAGTPAADVKRSASLPNTSRTIILVNKEGVIIDSVLYDGSIPEGSSWERVAPDSNQFAPQPTPSPTNSQL